MRKVLTLTLAATSALSLLTATPATAADRPRDLPSEVYGGAWTAGHVQGMAIDQRKGFMYFSFTNLLVKTDLQGKLVGSVTGFTGHLGDLDFNTQDGRVYGSLEYKEQESFYIAIFDVDRITAPDMDAQTTDVVKTVYLKEVVDDYVADMNGDGKFDGNVGNTPDHRYGCSGIDGVSFGPEFGKKHGKQKLTVAYGIYANTTRQDNDYQVLLQYDIQQWKKYERPLTESDPHKSGPERVDGKYFAYTGNTTYGVQNLQYDEHTGNWMMGVYKGTKPQFPNYPFFMVDGGARPRTGELAGQPQAERGKLLTLAPGGLQDAATGVRGWQFNGEYGLISLGGGRYYVAKADKVTEDGVSKHTGTAQLYRWTGQSPTPFERLG
ncbi:hypothetical protein BKM31_38955 [[Actinomadura] parvosata subsp. kistnae]|uniref:Uncharacterized protein n=2 Tax=Nonomuraea TaxID=83681 RepID=A0A1V0A8V0_9ACTN|nr:hypothetical protein [Nonomuraea sp. ATCC 55076]AQZ66638.1 hypothetical protein BKM31_38955 [Nonomuraea sp. ATCC 55076]